MSDTKTLREALAELREAQATLACMAQPQLVALDRAVERIEALAAQAQAEPAAWLYNVNGRAVLEQWRLDYYWRNQLGEFVKGVPLYTTPQPAAQPVAVPECRVAVIGHRWVPDEQVHVPQLLIEFKPVPANSPNTEQGWRDRDALAAMLAAAPKA